MFRVRIDFSDVKDLHVDTESVRQRPKTIVSLIPGFVEEVRTWASQFAAESRVPGWIARSYVWPEELSRVWDHLEDMRGSIIGIVRLQGVGKSSALRAIYGSRVERAWHHDIIVSPTGA